MYVYVIKSTSGVLFGCGNVFSTAGLPWGGVCVYAPSAVLFSSQCNETSALIVVLNPGYGPKLNVVYITMK